MNMKFNEMIQNNTSKNTNDPSNPKSCSAIIETRLLKQLITIFYDHGKIYIENLHAILVNAMILLTMNYELCILTINRIFRNQSIAINK